MAEHSSIEWTDATWNVVTGCQVVSPGCTNCYAMRLAGTRLKHHPSRVGLTQETKAGTVWNGEVSINWQWLEQPLTWKRRRRIFVAAHGDLFYAGIPTEVIAQVYGVMIAAVHLNGHEFQVLTKRAARAQELLTSEAFWDQANAHASMEVMSRVDPLDRRRGDGRATLREYGADDPPPGIWLGVSAEDQVRADERIPLLLETPAAVRFVSLEPLLGPINLTHLQQPIEGGFAWESALNGQRFDPWGDGDNDGYPKLDWVIVGGESGPGARPMHPDWVRKIRDDCDAAGVAFFFKQWGSWSATLAADDAPGLIAMDATGKRWTPGQGGPTAWLFENLGKKAAGRLLDGVEHNWMPGAGLG